MELDSLISEPRLFSKDTLINGRPTQINCVEVGGQTYSMTRGPLTVLRLEDEWFEDIRNPPAVIDALRGQRSFKADLFTFCQRLPDVTPAYPFHQEWESIAALPIQTYAHWWTKQIKDTARNKIRKSLKAGLDVRVCSFDDDFVRGMTTIFNETPIRQGRRFWHYGKDFETVKRQFSRYLSREQLLGAFWEGELVGFVMLGNAGSFADLGQIISMVKHRDKAVTNALLAKAVEICEKERFPYLVYAYWTDDSLVVFKRHSGFQEIRMPRYFVPLTRKGELALRTGLHRGWKTRLPRRLVAPLKRLRASWYASRESHAGA